MPAIKYKKKTYAGATFPVLEMTKAEYDALSDAKKMDGTVYMITDDNAGWEAERSTYDNTASGLTATNVQSALDEINSNLPSFSYQTNIIEGDNLNILMQAKSLTVNNDVQTEFTWPKAFGSIYFCWAQCIQLGFASSSTISVNGTTTGGKVNQKSGASMVIQVFGIGTKAT